jgi:hypothetical protein
VDRAMTLPIEQEEKDARISPIAFIRRSPAAPTSLCCRSCTRRARRAPPGCRYISCTSPARSSAPDGGPGRLSHGVLLAIGAPLVAFSPPIGVQAVIIIGHTLFGVGFAWSGYALFTARKNPPAEPHPAAR